MTAGRSVLLDSGGRPLRRPVVYLDHSTLVDAFDGKRGAAGPNAAINARLAAVVEEAARKGTLCISIIHVFELARRNEAVAMAEWLRDLDPLWFQMDGADEEELANEVKRRLGMKCPPPGRLPIHHAMSAAFRSSLLKNPALAIAAQSMLHSPDLASLIRSIHGHQGLGEQFEEVGASSVDFFARVHANRSSIPKGTPEHVEAERKIDENIPKQVEDEACRLINSALVEAGESYPSNDEIRRVVREALEDQGAIPLTKIGHQLARKVSDGITGQKARSGSFDNRFKGFGWDSRHAMAAAVVDVFTCDSFADSVMGDFRTSRGMERQISYRELDRAAFVAELRRQCSVASGTA